MVPDYVVLSANACQVGTTLISLGAYIPQWRKIIRTRSSKDISLYSWCLWIVSSSFALYYAIVQFLLNDRGLPLIMSSSASLGCILYTVWLVLRFRSERAT